MGQSRKELGIEDPLAVTWAAKYSDTLDKYWSRLPSYLGSFLASLTVFILGATVKGDWVHIIVHFMRAFRGDVDFQEALHVNSSSKNTWSDTLDYYYLKDYHYYWLSATLSSYVIYFGMGGFLHWYYYIRQRENAKDWKCQPNKFMTPELERQEILLGSFSLLIGSTLSAVISCYINNGGSSYVYYHIHQYGWSWWFISWPVVFIWQDYLTYWHHRIYHMPFLYKNFHKLHHAYKQPTAFSVTAIHPVEFVHMQMVMISPMFFFPTHWLVFVSCLLYQYYHGILDHSGINFKAQWWQPWQPDCIFHDNHHQYFHVNFGFNCELWDKIHGTYRQKEKVYREDIFYGKGKDIDDCSRDELKADLGERESENPLAYRGLVMDEQVDEVKRKLL